MLFRVEKTWNGNISLQVLVKLNFGNNFIKWISIMYNSISSQILINGHFSKDVNISRGVRQGCPLSPLLYVLFILI